jgi:thioredoxin-like negative regulator of GroEL
MKQREEDAMADPTVVTEDSFESEAIGAETPVLVDFYVDWCGPVARRRPR